MPLKYDPTFAQDVARLAPLLEGRPEYAVYDWEGRRVGFGAFISMLKDIVPSVSDVDVTVEHATAKDGFQIPVHVLQKKKDGSATNPAPGPAVLYSHGGGMICGEAGQFNMSNALWVSQTGIPFFNVDYRLAPENTGTGLVEDVYAALLWLRDNAARFNVDPARIAVFGESAGGGISAGVALKARDEGLSPPLAKQILVYPMIDDRTNKVDPELEPLAFWRITDNTTGWAALLGRDKAGIPDADVSYYAAPARAPSLKGLPSTYIDVGTLDYFRDEDLAYASRLTAENIEVDFHLYPGVPHAFEGLAPSIDITRRARENRLAAFKSL